MISLRLSVLKVRSELKQNKFKKCLFTFFPEIKFGAIDFCPTRLNIFNSELILQVKILNRYSSLDHIDHSDLDVIRNNMASFFVFEKYSFYFSRLYITFLKRQKFPRFQLYRSYFLENHSKILITCSAGLNESTLREIKLLGTHD